MPTPTHKLAELARIRPGYQTREAVRNDPAGTCCLLQIRDFVRDRTAINPRGMVRLSPKPRTSVSPLQPGEVVFLAKGASNFAFALADLPSATLAAGYFFVLTPDRRLLPAYLAWFLNHESTRALLSRLSTKGAHMPVIRRDILEALDIPLPPLAVQQTIVALDVLRLQQEHLLADMARNQHDLISHACMSAARAAITPHPSAPLSSPEQGTHP